MIKIKKIQRTAFALVLGLFLLLSLLFGVLLLNTFFSIAETPNLTAVDIDGMIKADAEFYAENELEDGVPSINFRPEINPTGNGTVVYDRENFTYSVSGSNSAGLYTVEKYGNASFSFTARVENLASRLLISARCVLNTDPNLTERAKGYQVWLTDTGVSLYSTWYRLVSEVSYRDTLGSETLDGETFYAMRYDIWNETDAYGNVTGITAEFYIDGVQIFSYTDTDTTRLGTYSADGYFGFGTYNNTSTLFIGGAEEEENTEITVVDLNAEATRGSFVQSGSVEYDGTVYVLNSSDRLRSAEKYGDALLCFTAGANLLEETGYFAIGVRGTENNTEGYEFRFYKKKVSLCDGKGSFLREIAYQDVLPEEYREPKGKKTLDPAREYVFKLTVYNVYEAGRVSSVALELTVEGFSVLSYKDGNASYSSEGYFYVCGFAETESAWWKFGSSVAVYEKAELDKLLRTGDSFTAVTNETGASETLNVKAEYGNSQYCLQGQNRTAIYTKEKYGDTSAFFTFSTNMTAQGDANFFLIGLRCRDNTSETLLTAGEGYRIFLYKDKLGINLYNRYVSAVSSTYASVLSDDCLDGNGCLLDGEEYKMQVSVHNEKDENGNILSVEIAVYIYDTAVKRYVIITEYTDEDASYEDSGYIAFGSYQRSNGSYFKIGRFPKGSETVHLLNGKLYQEAQVGSTAVTLTLDMAYGASIRLTEENGLRWTTLVGKESYDRLGEASSYLSFGTLIAPADLTDTEKEGTALTGYELTYASLEKTNGKDVVRENSWLDRQDLYAGSYAFVGSVVKIKDENLTRPFIALGYMKITYADGSSYTVYAELSTRKEGDRYATNVRSLAYVAGKAYAEGGYTEIAMGYLKNWSEGKNALCV